MHTLTMEGLLGAGMSAKLVDTPMRAAGEAERKGDRAAMERALGYAGEVTEQAEAYQEKTAKGMEKEAEEAKKSAKEQMEAAAEKRAEEREELEARGKEAVSENDATANAGQPAEPADLLELSEEGKRLSEGGSSSAGHGPAPENGSAEYPDGGGSVYTAAGEIAPFGEAEGVFSALA